jgi:hypothetical protein
MRTTEGGTGDASLRRLKASNNLPSLVSSTIRRMQGTLPTGNIRLMVLFNHLLLPQYRSWSSLIPLENSLISLTRDFLRPMLAATPEALR